LARPPDALAARLSQNATKLAVLFKPPVDATDPTALLEDTKTCAARLVALVDTVPPQLGRTYGAQVRAAGVQLLADLAKQGNSLLPAPLDVVHPITAAVAAHASAAYLQRTGLVWSAADVIAALPMSNAAAVAAHWKTMAPVLDDALSELAQLLEQPRRPDPDSAGQATPTADGEDSEDDEDEDEDEHDDGLLTTREAAVATDGQRLLRVLYVLAKTLVKRVVTPAEALPETLGVLPDDIVQWMDQLATHIGDLSRVFDNLAIALSAPQDPPSVRASALEAGRVGQALVDLADTVPPAVATAMDPARADADHAFIRRMAEELRTIVGRLGPEVVAR